MVGWCRSSSDGFRNRSYDVDIQEIQRIGEECADRLC